MSTSIPKAANTLREAIEQAGGDAAIAIMAPDPVANAFRAYVEAVRLDQIETANLQTHMDDEIKRLQDEAKP